MSRCWLRTNHWYEVTLSLSADRRACRRSPHSAIDASGSRAACYRRRKNAQLLRPMVFEGAPVRDFFDPPLFFFLAVRGLPLPPEGRDGGDV